MGAAVPVASDFGGREGRREDMEGTTSTPAAELVSRAFPRRFVHSLVKEADFLKVSFFHRRRTDGRTRTRADADGRTDTAKGGSGGGDNDDDDDSTQVPGTLAGALQ